MKQTHVRRVLRRHDNAMEFVLSSDARTATGMLLSSAASTVTAAAEVSEMSRDCSRQTRLEWSGRLMVASNFS